MRNGRLLVVALSAGLLVTSGCSVGSNSAPRAEAPPAPTPVAFRDAPTTAPAVDVRSILLDSAIYSIQQSHDFDGARTAYGRGVAIDPDSVPLNLAYVHRLIELEVPDFAYDAAQKVLATKPDDGASRGVLAFAEARTGQMSNALTDIARAVNASPNDPFIQDTAGHLLGWYDRVSPAPVMPETVQIDVRKTHSILDNEVVFGAAYQDASLYYLHERRQTDESNAAEPAPPVIIDGPVGGTAAGPVPFSSTPDAADAVIDDVAPIVDAIEPVFLEYSGFFVVSDFFGDFRHQHRFHHPGRRHDPEVTFRDHFFGRGYQTVATGGGRGVTAQAYLHDRFPSSFTLAGNRNGTVVSPNDRNAGSFRTGDQRNRNGGLVQGRLPAGVISGSPGFEYFNPGGIQAGGAVNMRAPGVNASSFGAIGLPPGFIAAPAPMPAAAPVAAPSPGPVVTSPAGRTATPARGATGGRGGSDGGRR
jgi:hypothetical protein